MTPKSFPASALSTTVALAMPFAAMSQADQAATTAAATTEAGTSADAAQNMATPAAEMQTVREKLVELGAKPLHTLTVEQARAQPTPADAVAAVMADKGIVAGPAAAISTRDFLIPSPRR